MENEKTSGRDNYINCNDLWMNIITGQTVTLDRKQSVMKRTFAAAVSALKRKSLLLASILGIGIAALGMHMLAFVLFVSEDFDVDLYQVISPLGIDRYDTLLVLCLAGSVPVLLMLIGTLITSISARRSGETMTCAGLVLVQAAAILGVVLYAALIVLLFVPPVIIISAFFVLMWATVFFSARNIKRSVKWGTPKRIPYPMAIFCFLSALSSCIFAIAFIGDGEDFIIWERLGFGALSFAALIASFCFEAFVHKYNSEIQVPRSMVSREKENKNTLFTVSDGEKKD